jgi:uncharacterized protein with von Willebrand factor type A (vWA) domain
VEVVTEKFGLFKNIPRSVVTEVTRYLREREADNDWFDSTALIARKYLKRLYALLHISPSERAQAILFNGKPPADSRLTAIKELRKAETAAEQAEAIIKNRIPYRIASTVIKSMTPTVILALIESMSDQELINNLGSLRKRGALDNADIKVLIKQRLDDAKRGKRVAALKSLEAAKVAGVDEEMQQQLADVADQQVKSRGIIKRSTALLIDKSGSMQQAIELGKRMGSMISAIMQPGVDFYCWAFDTMPYPIVTNSADLGAWEKAFVGIRAGGGTCCGAPLVAMRRQNQVVEQIIIITDEGENTAPAFLKSLEEYSEAFHVHPNVTVLRCGGHQVFSDKVARAGYEVQVHDFNGDYYSIPNLVHYLTKPSKLDLLMEIIEFPLPIRKLA